MSQSPKSQAREKLKAEYQTYLSRQRGLTPKTVYKYTTFVDRFLDFRFGENPDELAKITAGDIVDFLQHLTTRAQSLRDKTQASTLRSFFRFLFQSEKIQHNLALGIPSIAQKQGRRIPYHLTPEPTPGGRTKWQTMPLWKTQLRHGIINGSPGTSSPRSHRTTTGGYRLAQG